MTSYSHTCVVHRCRRSVHEMTQKEKTKHFWPQTNQKVWELNQIFLVSSALIHSLCFWLHLWPRMTPLNLVPPSRLLYLRSSHPRFRRGPLAIQLHSAPSVSLLHLGRTSPCLRCRQVICSTCISLDFVCCPPPSSPSSLSSSSWLFCLLAPSLHLLLFAIPLPHPVHSSICWRLLGGGEL